MQLEPQITAHDSVFDPGRRRHLVAPLGASVAEIVSLGYPSLPDAQRSLLRVQIGDIVVPQTMWARTRPKPGTQLVILPVPQGDAMRNVLMIAVTVAAVAAGQFYAPGLLTAIGIAEAGAVATSLASAVITSTTPNAGTMLRAVTG